MVSPVHVLMLSIQAVRGLPRLRAPGIVPCVISFSMQLPCFLAIPPNLAGPYCGQSILRIISKFDATRCQILRLKMLRPTPRWGSLQRQNPTRPPSCI